MYYLNVICITSLGTLGAFGLIYYNRYQIGLLALSLMQKKSPTVFSINETECSATLQYHRMSSEYNLLIPYDRSKVAVMTQFRVELLRDNQDPVEITQQPGIPYLVSAEQLGGSGIKICNLETGLYHIYDIKTIPLYGVEVCD